MKKTVLLILLSALAIFASPKKAFAHKISAFADVQDNKVSVLSYFSDGSPVRYGKVSVYDEKTGKLILSGNTTKDGQFSFKVPKPSNYKIVVNAELGHRAVVEVKKDEFSTTASAAPEESSEQGFEQQQEQGQSQASQISNKQLQKIVREAVRQELKPIHAELMQIEIAMSKPSLKDVIGGLGWIFGIFGVAALIYSRNRCDGK